MGKDDMEIRSAFKLNSLGRIRSHYITEFFFIVMMEWFRLWTVR